MKVPCKHDICAVVVTYNPDTATGERLSAIMAQTGRLIVVDNGSGSSTLDPLRKQLANQADLIANDQNLGVAAALNQGIRHSMSQGFRWVMTFDQDSDICEDFTSRMLECLAEHSALQRIGVIGANYTDSATRIESYPKRTELYFKTTTVITSGSLMSLEAFNAVGEFCEPLFIDLVDHEYCLRLLQAGYEVLVATKARMSHALGHRKLVPLPVGTLTLMNSLPLRRYYVARNSIFIARRYFAKFPKWVIHLLFGIYITDTVIKIPLENGPAKKWAAVGRGLKDGLLGRLGPVNVN